MRMYTAYGTSDHLVPDVRTEEVGEITSNELTETGVHHVRVSVHGDSSDWLIVASATDPEAAKKLWSDARGAAQDLVDLVHP